MEHRAKAPLAHAALRARRSNADDGYTLLELLIAIAIMPLVIGSLAFALYAILSQQQHEAARVSDAADAQTVSTSFERDVQSASLVTTSASIATQCGTGHQLLALEWSPTAQGAYQDVVSYVELHTGTTYSLVRRLCTSGPSATPTASSYVSYDVPSAQGSPTLTPAAKNTAATAGWVSVLGVTGITFAITEPDSQYAYSVTAVPKAATSSPTLSQVVTPNTTCGFAVPGSGTYASTMCFVDFSAYNFEATGGACQQIAAAVQNTPYTLSFCLKTTTTAPNGTKGYECNVSSEPLIAATVVPCPLPTYFDPPTSEAFLGNNGFYTGVPGDPSLYTNAEGSSTSIVLTNVELLDSNGNPATGWQLVTGDAESTDSGESITWSSDQLLSLVPDSPTSSIGNACQLSGEATPNAGLTPQSLLSGGSAATVTCQASVSNDKTGTVLLAAPAPTTMTSNLVGTGLQAIFVGVLLPS